MTYVNKCKKWRTVYWFNFYRKLTPYENEFFRNWYNNNDREGVLIIVENYQNYEPT